MKLLPIKMMAYITGKPRYFPAIEWSSKSWTHNAFRVWEMIFGRRYGIRAEIYTETFYEKGLRKQVSYARSWEGTCALTETYIRNFLRELSEWKWLHVRVWIPVMQTPQGVPVFASPYLFAIAFDAVTDLTGQANTNSVSINHTCTGSDRLLAGMTQIDTNSDNLTGVTYNSVSMTRAIESTTTTGGASRNYIYLLAAPATGTNAMAFSASTSVIFRENASSYTGCAQTGQPNGTGSRSNFNVVNTTVVDTTATSTVADTWGLLLTTNDRGTPIADTNALRRTSNTGAGYGYFDSNGSLGTAGTETMGWHLAGTGSNTCAVSMALIAPPASTTIKTWDGIARANLKTLDGVASANIKSINGIL